MSKAGCLQGAGAPGLCLLALACAALGCQGMGAPDSAPGSERADPETVDQGLSMLDWQRLRNPVLAEQDRLLDSPAAAFHGGQFFVFASAAPLEPARRDFVWHYFRTRDFESYQTLFAPQIVHAYAPDLARAHGRYYLVFQLASPYGQPETEVHPYGLFLASSTNLVQWEPAQPILNRLDPDARHFYGALAEHDGHLVAGYERWQHFYVTRTRNRRVDGQWLTPRKASADQAPARDFQFIQIDGEWRMVATGFSPSGPAGSSPHGGNHHPYIYRMDGTGERFDDWTRWVDKTPLEIPRESWNRVTLARGAYLCDWRDLDGHFYLFYAGAADDTAFDGVGHLKIGVARSRDLERWTVPGG